MLCGTGEYSIADFKAHHIVNGSSQEFRRVLDWFWAAVSNFSQTEMARLLQFTTGCSQLPHLGFQVSLQKQNQIMLNNAQSNIYFLRLFCLFFQSSTFLLFTGTKSQVSNNFCTNIC